MHIGEYQDLLFELFTIGWEIGEYETRNSPISYEDLKIQCVKFFNRRKEITERLINEYKSRND